VLTAVVGFGELARVVSATVLIAYLFESTIRAVTIAVELVPDDLESNGELLAFPAEGKLETEEIGAPYLEIDMFETELGTGLLELPAGVEYFGRLYDVEILEEFWVVLEISKEAGELPVVLDVPDKNIELLVVLDIPEGTTELLVVLEIPEENIDVLVVLGIPVETAGLMVVLGVPEEKMELVDVLEVPDDTAELLVVLEIPE
jgi:hypothetical protein